jgi:hypothetical protein
MTGARQSAISGLADRLRVVGLASKGARILPARSHPPWSAHCTSQLPPSFRALSALPLKKPVVVLDGAG